jgi:hypothetical protein
VRTTPRVRSSLQPPFCELLEVGAEPCDPSADFILAPAEHASAAPLVNVNAITATILK